MNRRHFLVLGLSIFPYAAELFAVDYRKSNPLAWEASSINDAAMALYGREKFSTIQKSTAIELIVPRGIVRDPESIPITIRSTLKAKNLAIFQDANPKSLVAVFDINKGSVIEYEIPIRMEFKGTVFAVVEGLDAKLYYTREFIEVLHLSCMGSGE